MDRRTILRAGVATGLPLAGCLGTGSPAGAPTTDGERTGATTDGGTPAGRIVTEWAHNDVPPYEVRPPEPGTSEEEWNPEYLGEGMPTDPTLPFETVVGRAPATVWDRDRPGNWGYVVETAASLDDLRSVLDLGKLDGGERERVESVDFGESVLVLVGDCCGSSSVEHRWGRVEPTSGGIHLHGYLTNPRVRTMDSSPRYSLVEVERPADEVDRARVSLTVREDTRIHFDSTEGTVDLVAGVVANDRPEDVTLGLRIATGEGEVRVDDEFAVEGNFEWKGLGLLGEADETFAVEVRAEGAGIDATDTHRGDAGTLGIRLLADGGVAVGPSNEI